MKLKDLASEEVEEFLEARQLERNSILAANAIRVMPPKEAEATRREHPDRLMPSRHCYAWKKKDGGRTARRWWVGRGDQDPGLT